MINDRISSDSSAIRSRDISFYEYLYVFVLIIYGGLASNFVRSFGPEKPLAVLLPVVLSIMLALRFKIIFTKHIFLLFLFYTLYNFALFLKYKSVYPIFFGRLLVNFLIAYITIKALRFKFFIIYERILYYLTIVALTMWVIQLAMGGDNLLKILGRIPGIDEFSAVTGGGVNIIIYSVQPFSHLISSNSSFARNCGFAWEPGAFAVFICLAILINMFFIKQKDKRNKHLWLFLLGLLSTQSTTGYVILIIIMIFYFLQKNIKMVLLLFPVIILIIISLFSLPFMKNKILNVFEEANRVDVIVAESVGIERARNPQRIASFVITIRDFINNPILGYGGQTEDRWYYKLSSNIAPISGIGNFLAQYGMVGFMFFVTLLIKSSRAYSRYFDYKGEYLLFLIILMIAISYSIILSPIIMSFWMFSFFENYGSDQLVADPNNLNVAKSKLK